VSRPFTEENFRARMELALDAGLAALESRNRGDFEEAAKTLRWIEESLLRERDRK